MSLEKYVNYSTKTTNSTITYFYEFESLLTFRFVISGKESKYFYFNNYLNFIFEKSYKEYLTKYTELRVLKKKELALLEPNKTLYNLKVNNVLKSVLINNVLLQQKTTKHEDQEELQRYIIERYVRNNILEFEKLKLSYFLNLSKNIVKLNKELKEKIQEKKNIKFEVYKIGNNRLNLDVYSIINSFL